MSKSSSVLAAAHPKRIQQGKATSQRYLGHKMMVMTAGYSLPSYPLPSVQSALPALPASPVCWDPKPRGLQSRMCDLRQNMEKKSSVPESREDGWLQGTGSQSQAPWWHPGRQVAGLELLEGDGRATPQGNSRSCGSLGQQKPQPLLCCQHDVTDRLFCRMPARPCSSLTGGRLAGPVLPVAISPWGWQHSQPAAPPEQSWGSGKRSLSEMPAGIWHFISRWGEWLWWACSPSPTEPGTGGHRWGNHLGTHWQEQHPFLAGSSLPLSHC